MQPRSPYIRYAMHTAFLVIAFGSLCFGQLAKSTDDVITVAPPDTLTARAQTIASAMDFSAREASAFWPIYQQYESERSKLAACRSEVLDEYGDKYITMNNNEAKALANRMFDCDARLTSLKKKYFRKFNKVLPAYTVVKFFQVEHRIDSQENTRLEYTLLPPLRPSYGNVK